MHLSLRKCKKILNGAFGADFDVYGQQKLVSKRKTPGNTRSVADYVPQLGTDLVLIEVLYTSAKIAKILWTNCQSWRDREPSGQGRTFLIFDGVSLEGLREAQGLQR